MLDFFWKGIIVGLAVSAPMGPIGVLCVQKTVNKGKWLGFISGMGAASADTLYAVIAAFSLTSVQAFLLTFQQSLQVIGIAVLLFLGLKIFYTNPARQLRKQARKKRHGILGDYLSVFFLTFSNPLTVLFFGAAFAAIGLFGQEYNYRSAFMLISGTFTGATVWWFILTSIVHSIKHRISLKSLWWINKISGGVIVILAVASAAGFVYLLVTKT